MKHIKFFEEVTDDKFVSKKHPNESEIINDIEDILLVFVDENVCRFKVEGVVIDYINKDNIAAIHMYFSQNQDEVGRDELYERVSNRLEKFGYKKDSLYLKTSSKYEFIVLVKNKYKI